MAAPTAAALDALVRASGLPADSPRLPLRPRGLAPQPSLLAELGVIVSSLLSIGSVPGYPILLVFLLRRAWNADPKEPGKRRRAWLCFAVALAFYVWLLTTPVPRRPGLMQGRLWRWWLEYMSVRVAYRSGEVLPQGQYLFLMMPHGLYPFSGACASLSKLTGIFQNMRIAVAPAGLKIPVVRHLMGWIGCISAGRSSIGNALAGGDSVGLFPGGIGEMMRTQGDMERVILLSRKGFIREALKQGVPIVPVYVLGQSLAFVHWQLPVWVERLSRRIRLSIIIPFGRFGMLIPRKLPLLYAIGKPILCPKLAEGTAAPDAQVDQIHGMVVDSVRDLYDAYKGFYGWSGRQLSIE